MRLEQRLADRSSQAPGRATSTSQARDVEHDPPRQRIAVGVQPGGRQADEHVARRDRSAVDQPLARDGADDEAGDVVFAVGVEARHLRRLAAEERAAVLAARARQALDDLHGHVRLEPAGREVVEEEQRLARPGRGCR